mgnify:CR=1 FL=1
MGSEMCIRDSIYAVLKDGTEVDWSYQKCVYNMFSSYDRRYDVLAVFRRAVEDQIAMFKRRGMFEKYVITDSGKLIPSEEAHVHHEPPSRS